MRALALALLLTSCAGSPDSVTVFGARGTAAYTNAAGQPAFDEQGYSYGLALTWQLPTPHRELQDERQLAILDALRQLEIDEHDQLLLASGQKPTSVVVETAPAAKSDDDNTITAKTKTILGLVAAALGVAVLAALKRVGANRKKIAALEKTKTPQKGSAPS